MRLSEIHEQIGRGQYQVDAHAVAEAIVRRLLQEHKVTVSEHRPAQVELRSSG